MNGPDQDTDQQGLPWSRLYQARVEMQRRFGKIWDLPVAKRYSSVLLEHGTDGASVLEVGGGTRGLEGRLLRSWPNVRYRSLDIDRTSRHDFYRWQDVVGDYDIVCMFDVIEHVRPLQAQDLLLHCRRVLRPRGVLLATTPNIYHPPTFLRDATHVTPWCYDELGAVATLAGFRVDKLLRLYSDSLWGRVVHRGLLYPVHRALSIDFATHVMMVALP